MINKFFQTYNTLKHKGVLLHRFHITVIAVNLIATGLDLYLGRYYNAIVEATAVILLLMSLRYLHVKANVTVSAYLFLAITAAALYTLIGINHFATMSVVFVLLLPLSTLLFLRLRDSLSIATLLIAMMVALLYYEHLGNPDNPITQNPQALFNLAYAAAIIYLFGILYHLSIVKTFDELDQANRQKSLLLSEVHHRVKNNLNVIASIIGLQANRLGDNEKQHLLSTKTRIESIAMVHEMLYKCDDFENIGFSAYVHQLSQLLLQMYASQKDITLTITSTQENMPLETMIQLGMIINELLTNSIKYAFKQNSGHVIINLKSHKGQYVLTYSDNGIGVEEPETLLQSKSLGIKIIHLAAKQLKGTVRLENHEGLTYTIEFEHE